jgi:hypothetical protein
MNRKFKNPSVCRIAAVMDHEGIDFSAGRVHYFDQQKFPPFVNNKNQVAMIGHSI